MITVLEKDRSYAQVTSELCDDVCLLYCVTVLLCFKYASRYSLQSFYALDNRKDIWSEKNPIQTITISTLANPAWPGVILKKYCHWMQSTKQSILFFIVT